MSHDRGRIGDLITRLEASTGRPISLIDPQTKLKALCTSLKMPPVVFDMMLASRPEVARTLKGHAFEGYFDKLMAVNGYVSTEVGGDDAIDRVVNRHSLQLKTPTVKGSSEKVVAYKTHNTHGAKSEVEGMDYYKRAADFADYLVGLVSYDPCRILVLRKDELPRHPKSHKLIKSPFSVEWASHPGLNAFSRIGVSLTKPYQATPVAGAECLPLTSALLGINSDAILTAILNRNNFRIWDMNIRGFARQAMFEVFAHKHKIEHSEPSRKSARGDKADYVVTIANRKRLAQVKGVSQGKCAFDRDDPILVVETMLTRGRMNDHPTQSRLYRVDDFEVLIVAVDPVIVTTCRRLADGEGDWEFYFVPTSTLKTHRKYPMRLNAVQRLSYATLQQYLVTGRR